MNTSYLNRYLIILLLIWTLLIAIFLIYDFAGITSNVKFNDGLENEQLIKDTALKQWTVKYQKRSLVLFFLLYTMGVLALLAGFRAFKKQYISDFEKKSILKSSEEKFRRYFEDNMAIMLFVDPITKNIINVNSAAIKFYGYTREEFLKMRIYDVNTVPYEEIDRKMKVAIMQKANHLYFEHKLANGEIRDVEMYASPFLFKDGKMMSVIVHDVTEQKKAENALKSSKIKHQEISKLLETLFDSIPDIIGIQDNKHNVIRYNKAGYDYLNLTYQQVVGKKCYKLIGCDTPCKVCATTLVYNTKKASKVERYDEKLNTWLEIRAYPIFDENGEVFQVIEHLRDITDRKRFIDDLKNAKEKAEESDKLKSSFLANMSHEIRTPMNAILGFAELLNHDTLALDDKKEYVEIIRNSGIHLLDIINDIIDISKIDAKQLDIVETDFDLNILLLEIYQFFQSLIIEKGDKQVPLILHIDKPEVEKSISTDKSRLRQVLINLVGNAIKFTEKGSIELSYEIKNSDTILFSVKDSGIGMTPDELKYVFDRFRQGDETYNRVFGGTGLGLSISKEFVELLGGRIWAESVKGEGSVFYFTLPFKSAVRTQSNVTEKVEKDKSEKLEGITILIVEDEEYSLLILEELLKQSGVIILTANDGLQAIQSCIDNPEINLVLMDIQLPRLDGLEATRRIKKIKPDLPIIAQTANVLHEDKQRALSAGCNDYLSKPIDSKKLSKMVYKYLA
ncbi:MAG: ATP-binding protein [Bacteroidota bacterium]